MTSLFQSNAETYQCTRLDQHSTRVISCNYLERSLVCNSERQRNIWGDQQFELGECAQMFNYDEQLRQSHSQVSLSNITLHFKHFRSVLQAEIPFADR